MDETILENLLEEYDDEDYVYIIDGCMDWYSSLKPCENEVCPICGNYDSEITSGFVKELKKLKTRENIENYNITRLKQRDAKEKTKIKRKNK